MPERTEDPGLAPVVLVACGAAKLPHAACAADLYTGDLFRKSRAWAERYGHCWLILSAKHGLLPPGAWIEPYDETLTTKSPAELAEWGRRVSHQWVHDDSRPVVILAGRRYRQWCDGRGYSVPMAGLGIGQQKAWLKARLTTATTT